MSGISPQLAAELGAAPDSRLLRYPGSTLTTVLLNLRVEPPRVRRPEGPHRAARRHRPGGHHRWAPTRSRRPRPRARSRPRRPGSTRRPTRPSRSIGPPRRRRSRTPAGRRRTTAGTCRDAKNPAPHRAPQPDDGRQPGPVRGRRRASPPTGPRSASTSTTSRCRRASSSPTGWPRATFQVAVVDVIVGLDPDLYPLLASSQTLTGGSNIAGVQSVALDDLLLKARAPGTDAERKAAYSALQKQLASGSLPAAADLRRRGRGRPRHARRTRRPAGHRSVGSILGCANMAPRRRPVTVGGVRAEVAE